MSAVIRLLDSAGKKVLDSVSCDYEDSFSLDSFGELINMHQDAEPKGTKSFIIARVQTWDHKQPDKAFFSYYDAYHLNKILFQTQVYLDKKLIHRLHVLNPLTNTDIIGNVQYFIVKATPNKPQPNPVAQADINTPIKTANLIEMSPTTKKVGSPTKKGPHLALPPIKTNVNPISHGDLPPPSPSVKEVESGSNPSWTLSTPLSNVFVEEGEEEYKSPTAGFSGMVRKMSQSISPRRESMSPHRPSMSPTRQPQIVVQPVQLGGKDSESNKTSASRLEGVSGLQIVTKQPTSPVFLYPSRTQEQQVRIEIPAGTVTRFGQPVEETDMNVVTPRTAKSRRRSLSYLNAVSATGQKPSFQEWISMVKEEDEEGEGDQKVSDQTQEDYDKVKPFGSPASQQALTEAATELKKPRKLSLFPGKDNDSKKDMVALPKEETEAEGTVTYDAILFATDNDFLESSRVRSIFKENAQTPQDAVLFEMPPYTGAEEESPLLIVVDDPPVCDLCYPSDRSVRHMSPFMQLVHRNKCYLIALVLMMAVFLFIYL
ncbi:hypothetical protein HDV05_005349 [Chytridiales sp. JEL 0842]|nr:hypothetical protein HDV05_005349 [Chytridiales sp. JEL 0842]